MRSITKFELHVLVLDWVDNTIDFENRGCVEIEFALSELPFVYL